MFQTISETVRNSNIKEKNVFLYEMIFYDTQVSNLNNSFYSPMSKYNNQKIQWFKTLGLTIDD